ncbi:MAG: FliJ family protein [Epsilonproteobacteria bacterium]|nr:FliJ family protein [Campylobacterota bacterium]
MKTKFDSLVKLKKMEVEKIENEISQINNQISTLQTQIDQLTQELLQITLPKEGNFAVITQISAMKKAINEQIELKRQNIAFLRGQKNLLNEKLKEANLEYEKMKYLQAEEIKKYLQKLKEKEAKNLDEIALMLFQRKH